MSATKTKLSYNLAETVEATGLSRSYWQRVIQAGDLPARKSGKNSDDEPSGSYVILARDLEAYLEGLAEA